MNGSRDRRRPDEEAVALFGEFARLNFEIEAAA